MRNYITAISTALVVTIFAAMFSNSSQLKNITQLFAQTPNGSTQTINFKGSIAYSADGNSHDRDDIGATPMGLGLLAYAGLQSKVVHYDYNSNVSNNGSNNQKADMTESTLEGARRFDFNSSVFFSAYDNKEATYNHIAKVINQSSAENPLYYIVAGPFEVACQGIRRSETSKRQYVTLISHSDWNDEFKTGSGCTAQQVRNENSQHGLKYVRIKGQNQGTNTQSWGGGYARYDWMTSHPDPNIRWIYDRMKKAFSSYADPSDSGMVYYLITGGVNGGDQNASPEKFRDWFNKKPATNQPNPTNNNSNSSQNNRLKYYGADEVAIEDLGYMKSQGMNFVMTSMWPNRSEWERYLKEAEKHDLKVIIWPVGTCMKNSSIPWCLNNGTWDMSRGRDALAYAQQYVQSGGKALLGVMSIHEPYWSAGLNINTANNDIKNLYSEMKKIAPDVNVFIYMDGIADTEKTYSQARITNGMADIIGVWLHCFGEAEGSCEDARQSILNDRRIMTERNITADLFFSVQTFGGTTDGPYKMPTYNELKSFTCSAINLNALDGILYYPWRNPAQYRDYMQNHPQLHGVIKDVHQNCIRSLSNPTASSNPQPSPSTRTSTPSSMPSQSPITNLPSINPSTPTPPIGGSASCSATGSTLSQAQSNFRQTCGVEYRKSLGHDCDFVSNRWLCANSEIVDGRIKNSSSNNTYVCTATGNSWSNAVEAFEQACNVSYGQHKGHDCDYVGNRWLCANFEIINGKIMVPNNSNPTPSISPSPSQTSNNPPSTQAPKSTPSNSPVSTVGGNNSCSANVNLDRNISLQPQQFSQRPISGPGRGAYKWADSTPIFQWTSNNQPYEDYTRIKWTDLENQKDQYNLSVIRNRLNNLPPGAKFGFGIRTLVDCSNTNNNATPQYMRTEGYAKVRCGNNLEPDYNDPRFQARLDKLLATIGKEFTNDPRLGFLDIRIVGYWGEWVYQSIQPTSQTAEFIVAKHQQHFPNQKLVVMTQGTQALGVVLNNDKYKDIGWRRDSLGDVCWTCNNQKPYRHFITIYDSVNKNLGSSALVKFKDRWKTAPVITELFGHERVKTDYLVQEVKDFHVSMVGNGNQGNEKGNTDFATNIEKYYEAVRNAGFSYTIKNISHPSSVNKGNSLKIATTWANLGNAPTYENWQVRFNLVSSNNQNYSFTSNNIDLKQIIPNDNLTGEKLFNIESCFNLPNNISSGSYSLNIQITDPKNYRKPLELNINRNKNSDGSYKISDIRVN